MDYSFLTEFFLGDIGSIVMPPVDESDPEVEKILRISWPVRPDYGFTKDYVDYAYALNRAILEVSLERRYSWAAMYVEDDPMTNQEDESLAKYIFTLRHPVQPVRYAVQHPFSFVYKRIGEQYIDPLFNDRPDLNLNRPRPVLPGDGQLWQDPRFRDRRLPVPWRVALDDISTGHNPAYHKNGATHFYYDHANGARAIDSTTGQPLIYPQTFSVDKSVGVLLRPGSIIIDADPRDIYWGRMIASGEPYIYDRTFDGYGYVYEVQSVEAVDPYNPNTRYWITLKTPLLNDMVYFWVFPPPIERKEGGSYEFVGQQPVVNMTKKLIG